MSQIQLLPLVLFDSKNKKKKRREEERRKEKKKEERRELAKANKKMIRRVTYIARVCCITNKSIYINKNQIN